MSESEEIFKALMDGLCISRNGGLRYKDLRQEEHTTDFVISTLCDSIEYPCAFEIKQIDKSEIEKSTKSGEGFAMKNVQRIHKCIDESSDQIRNTTKGIFPGILVIWDNSLTRILCDPYAIWHGCFGHDMLSVDPLNKESSYRFVGGDRGLNIKCGNEYKRRHINGIAILVATNCIYIDLYRNPYANIKMHYSLDSLFRKKYFTRLNEHDQLINDMWEEETGVFN